MTVVRLSVMVLAITAVLGGLVVAGEQAKEKQSDPAEVSYYRDIRPIVQQNCQGCHQPAKDSGGYVMTSHAGLLKTGDSDLPAIVPGKPDESYLVSQITPQEG